MLPNPQAPIIWSYRGLSCEAPFCQVGPCPLIAVYDGAR
jgi:hypothetical protein